MQVSDEQAAALEAKGITKRFGNTVALRAVDARLDAGRCLALSVETGRANPRWCRFSVV